VQTYIATVSPTIDGSTFLVVVGFMALLAALVTMLWATWNWIGRKIALRRYQETRPDWQPARYPYCRSCEGAEELGPAYLIQHQERDHVGGVRPW
jgi:hypothetical protein